MSRFIQQDYKAPAPKQEKPVPKFGGSDGKKDYSSLAMGKKIPTKGGFK